MATVRIPEIREDKGFLPRQTKMLLGAFLILGAIALFAATALQGNQQYFLTLAELKLRGDAVTKQTVRIGGSLLPDSTHVNSKEVTAQFTLTDGSNNLVPVYYKGVLPDTFEKSTEVIAEGKLDGNGVFQASLVLAKCPSKYDPAQTEWRSSTEQGNLNYTTSK